MIITLVIKITKALLTRITIIIVVVGIVIVIHSNNNYHFSSNFILIITSVHHPHRVPIPHLPQEGSRQRLEDHDVIQAIQQLRPQGAADALQHQLLGPGEGKNDGRNM